ncbi:uncharacterized protein DDB_G0290685-like isoform X2 [Toxotes jaculatrix]|uniref:uncharacterized protein DDB_G0290685-like isoform X2 n=1 Tax=Toxotes jaculatrix TaxID=941984 RepID=UPI001B3AE58C|nr:uncharacterized protein DDB_G0290685-like isoform X2 [Toxotes jaculatrix]
MSCRWTALCVSFLLFLLRVQGIELVHARSLSALPDFELPEVDGSAVDDTCRIFPDPTPDPTPDLTTTSTTSTTTATTRPPITRKVTVKSTKDTGAPIRPQPAPSGPITNSNPAAILLYYLLTNGRGRAAGSLPGFNSKGTRGKVGSRRGAGSSSSEDSSDEN